MTALERRLLIVEDNPGDAELLLARLDEGGRHDTTAVAATLAEAAARLEGERPDAVLLDLHLPDARGLEGVRWLRARVPEVPIVVLTTVDDEDLALRCIDAGAQDYLTKDDAGARPLCRAIARAIARMEERGRSRAELGRRQERLVARDREMRALAARLNAVREEERARVSHEVHHEVGHVLAALKLDLEWIERRVASGAPASREPLLERLAESGRLVDHAIATIRAIALELRPSALDARGLPEAVRDEVRRFEARTGIPTECAVDGDPRPEPEAGTALFRVLQELLSNVSRHARASVVRVALAEDGEDWLLAVEDDGVGARAAPRRPGAVGLVGVRERLEELGGGFELVTAAGAGTIARARVPRA